MKDIQKYLEQTINELDFLNDNEEFLLKDLFKGYEWKRLKNFRTILGAAFLDKVNKDETLKKKIEILEKTSSNQQLYKKLKGDK